MGEKGGGEKGFEYFYYETFNSKNVGYVGGGGGGGGLKKVKCSELITHRPPPIINDRSLILFKRTVPVLT